MEFPEGADMKAPGRFLPLLGAFFYYLIMDFLYNFPFLLSLLGRKLKQNDSTLGPSKRN
jgi:hypothetical protein